MKTFLEEIRDQKERDAKYYSEEIKKYLTIADIALKAVIKAANHGNLRCQQALKEIIPMLPTPSNAVGSTPVEDSKEHKEVWSHWQKHLAEKAGEQSMPDVRKSKSRDKKALRKLPRKVQRRSTKKKT